MKVIIAPFLCPPQNCHFKTDINCWFRMIKSNLEKDLQFQLHTENTFPKSPAARLLESHDNTIIVIVVIGFVGYAFVLSCCTHAMFLMCFFFSFTENTYWHSGVITRRISDKLVQTESGSLYKLEGHMECMDAMYAGN